MTGNWTVDHGNYQLVVRWQDRTIIGCPICGRLIVLGGEDGRVIVSDGDRVAHHNSFALGDWTVGAAQVKRSKPDDYTALFGLKQ